MKIFGYPNAYINPMLINISAEFEIARYDEWLFYAEKEDE